MGLVPLLLISHDMPICNLIRLHVGAFEDIANIGYPVPVHDSSNL